MACLNRSEFFSVCFRLFLTYFIPGTVAKQMRPNEPQKPPPVKKPAAEVVETASAVAGLPTGSNPAPSGLAPVAID